MKKLLTVFLLLASFPAIAQIVTIHSATLNWAASPDSGVTYNVYRADGKCTETPLVSPTKLTNTSLLTYVDTTVLAGNTYCYTVRSVNSSGVESVDSNYAGGIIPFAPPSGLTVTVK